MRQAMKKNNNNKTKYNNLALAVAWAHCGNMFS